MSLRYTLRESLSGFTRTKLATAVSIITIAISLLLLGVFAILTIHTSRFIEALRNKVELEVFLQEPLTRQDITDLQTRVRGIEGVAGVVYISKDEAARIFKEEFGEDIHRVLEFNPLPPSFKISLRDGYKTAARTREVVDRLTALKGVDNVIYRKELLELIDRQTASANNLALGLGVFVSLSAIFLVSNTIRLAIYAKRRLIRTMELVGATSGFIRLPFLLEGIMQGIAGGVAAAAVLYLLLEYASRFVAAEFPAYIRMDASFYALVVVTGMALGLLGSIISILRFIRNARTA
jgi:cell division transport system permease protein